uniref:phenylalanyl-tRNA synthetase beta subunit n=1 Tax=Stylonema alsidii TaxID=35155 RepID=UPI001FCCE833|nr:phenylalanyl-tRNA synthetase beta subunit [Stylonema alsidii]UNJ15124.1 phenylalanyl-tRNA synthetase beta subunit [Stylonema alsidii]
MKISFNCLSNIINTSNIEIEDLSEKLTLAGFEVDAINYLEKNSDIILDIITPPNRGDTLSTRGLAREIAALYKIPYSSPNTTTEFPCKKNETLIQFKKLNNCFFYSIYILENLQIKPSPVWLKNYLEAIDVVSTNNLQDILNYILLEYGQPIEAFTFDNLSETLEFEVNTPNQNINFTNRNSEIIELNESNLVSFLNQKAINLCGIVGNKDNQITNSTTSIILEIAIFNPRTIRQSSSSVNLKNDISLRFERGLDLNMLNIATQTAMNLILELCGGYLTSSNFIQLKNYPEEEIILRLANIQHLLGTTIHEYSTIESILQQLGFQYITYQEYWVVKIPIHRTHDIEREIDLIEEIGRIYGFNNFPHILPNPENIAPLSLRNQMFSYVKNFFISKGFYELTHYSFQKLIPKSIYSTPIHITNPLTIEQKFLRYSILPELINNFLYNISQGNNSFNSFEIGRIFSCTKANKFNEQDALAGILGGHLVKSNWNEKHRSLNWFEAKGIINSFFKFCNIPITWKQEASVQYFNNILFHKFRWAGLYVNGTQIGIFAQINPKVIINSGFNSNLYIFEISLESILKFSQITTYYQQIFESYSIYPTICRDINMLVPLEMPIGEILSNIHNIKKDILQSIDLFDDYRDSKLKEKKRLSFRLAFRSNIRTLNIEEVDHYMKDLQSFLFNELQITLTI